MKNILSLVEEKLQQNAMTIEYLRKQNKQLEAENEALKNQKASPNK